MPRSPLTLLCAAVLGALVVVTPSAAARPATQAGVAAHAAAATTTSHSTPKHAVRVPSPTSTTPTPSELPRPSCTGRTPGFHELTTTVAGVSRRYTVYAPPSWRPTLRVPAVYIFHGTGGEATGTIWGSKMKVQADQDGFLVVAPQGLGSPAEWSVTPGTPRLTGNDQLLVAQLPATIATTWCVDAARQYAVGYSAGSMLTHALACTGGFPYAGYGGSAAQPWSTSCPAPTPFDFVYFHGTADPYIPFTGNAELPSVEWTATTMAARNGCEAQPTTTRIGTDVTSYLWSHCRGGVRQLVDVVEGGGHIWPGADYIPHLGPQTTSISADQVVSDFWHLAS